ncbi:SOUL family heme-binding protein [Mycobacterium sp. URHB0021]|jgi:hypothetical protein
MQIIKIPGQILESALSIAGIRIGTEEPHCLRRPLTDSVEIRRYGPRIAAETTVNDNEDRARGVGFRRLADYIFGANERDDTISMTAPVAQARGSDGRWTIRFFMPSKWTMDTLPAPDSEDVTLVTAPGETVAVLRFSGDRGPKAVAARTDELIRTLLDNGIEPVGDAVAWFYDPPWTVPFRRRNEIAIPVVDPT